MSCNFKPYKGKEKYIFVSYAHADKKVVLPILEELNAAGFRIWYDEGIEWGTEFNDFIATRICECDAVIAFHSNASSESEYCKHEINYALKQKKSVLSVYLDDVELSPGMAMQLSSYQSTFWYQYKDKSEFFKRLIEDTPILKPCRESSNSHVIQSNRVVNRKVVRKMNTRTNVMSKFITSHKRAFTVVMLLILFIMVWCVDIVFSPIFSVYIVYVYTAGGVILPVGAILVKLADGRIVGKSIKHRVTKKALRLVMIAVTITIASFVTVYVFDNLNLSLYLVCAIAALPMPVGAVLSLLIMNEFHK